MSDIKYHKHVEALAKATEARDAKKAILQTWEEWREGKVKCRRKVKIEDDPEYIRDLTRRARNLTVRVENMKPISELDEV